MISHHVHHAYARYGNLEKVGAHVDGGAYKQSAVRAALDSEQPGICPATVDHILGCGNEVIEHVELVELGAGEMPFLAILASATEVGLGIYASVFKPEDTLVRTRG